MVVAQLRGAEFKNGDLHDKDMNGWYPVVGVGTGRNQLLSLQSLGDISDWLGFNDTGEYLAVSSKHGRDVLKGKQQLEAEGKRSP